MQLNYAPYKIVAQLIHRSGAVLEIGGSQKKLRQFLPANITLFTVGVIGGDVLYDGKNLPFSDKSVETLISIDTIERLPVVKRELFMKELTRVAKKRVVIAAHLSTTAHVRIGLPTMKEIKQLVQPFPSHNLLFQAEMNNPGIGRLWSEIKKIIWDKAVPFNQSTNRFYLQINL